MDLATEVEVARQKIPQLEREAQEHETQARLKRAERMELKTKLGELELALRHSESQRATNNAANAAAKAQQAAEAAKTEASVVLDRLKAKEKQVDELLAKLAQPAAEPTDAPDVDIAP